MKTFLDLCTDLNSIASKVTALGGTVNNSGKYASISDILEGIETIPQTKFEGTNYSITCADTQATTFKLKKDGIIISAKTNDESIGGTVTFTVTESGEYEIVAEQNAAIKWSNKINIVNPGAYNCKCGNLLDTYSEDEIELACKNHYARYMWNEGDFKTCASFMGTSDANLKKRYILGFAQDELSDGSGYAEISWGWLNGTPSQYKMHASSIANVSFVGCDARKYLIPSDEYIYTYDSTVASSTEGTYYAYNFVAQGWDEKTLPDEYVTGVDYYKRSQATSNGAIYDGIPADLISRFVKTKQYTWVGHTTTENSKYSSSILKQNSTSVIRTDDKLFILSGHQMFGDSIFTGYFGHNNNENKQYDLFKNYKGYAGNLLGSSQYKWFRSPAVANSSHFCTWINTGYVDDNSAYGSSRLLVCACQ